MSFGKLMLVVFLATVLAASQGAVDPTLRLDRVKVIAVMSSDGTDEGSFEHGAMREVLRKGYRVVTVQNRSLALAELRRIESREYSQEKRPAPGLLKIAPYILILRMPNDSTPGITQFPK